MNARVGEAGAAEPNDIGALSAQCAADPSVIGPRIALAKLLLATQRAAEAVVPAEQAVALNPNSSEAAQVRDAVLAAVLAGDPDLVRLELAAALAPTDADAQLAVGSAYAGLDRPHDAERCFKAALALGRTRDAHAELASLYLTVLMLDAAEHHARESLGAADRGAEDDTVFAMAHQTLAAVATAQGEALPAEAHLDAAYARCSVFRQQAAGCPFTTLVLVSRRAGNVPLAALLPPLKSDLVLWYMEHARLEQMADLPPYAVVLNAFGDRDVAGASAAIVEAVSAACERPVLNPPTKVAASARDRLGQTLAGLADVIVPATVRVSGEAIAADGLAGTAKAAGMATPLLVRPLASHGGQGLTLARDDAELAAMRAPAGEAYLTAFHDCASPDGFHRKYRMIFVGGRPHAYHLAISPHWMAHHQTSEMAGDAARMAEELRFLENPEAAIGARAMAAVAAIGARLGFDYGGIDFAVTAEGQVLVFEANATMLTHLEPADGPFAAKNPYVTRIIEAFRAHLASAAASA